MIQKLWLEFEYFFIFIFQSHIQIDRSDRI